MLINPKAFIDQLAQAFLGRHESFIFIWEFSLNTKNEKSYYSLRLLRFIGMNRGVQRGGHPHLRWGAREGPLDKRKKETKRRKRKKKKEKKRKKEKS